MANLATTTYKVTGTREAVNNLWTTLQNMEVDSKDIWLFKLAEHYGIDYEKKQISVRGHIYWAEYEEEEENDYYLLSLDAETAWDACNELFLEINRILGDELSISYRFFPEECCVSSYGEPFEDACEDVFDTIEDAIAEWTSKTGIGQGDRSEKEMVDFINSYGYESEETYFYIHPFAFE